MTAIRTGAYRTPSAPRIVRIQNTLKLDELWVSEAVVPEYAALEHTQLLDEVTMAFDENGRLLPM